MKPPAFGAGSVLLPIVMAGLWLMFERSTALGQVANGYLALFSLLGVLGIIANLALASWIF